MPEVVSLGEPMVEFAAEERGRLGDVTAFRRGFGGDTSNFIVAAARLGASAGYLTRVGGDEFGRAFLGLWLREGVDTSRVVVEPEGYTAVYFISLREEGGHDFTYYRAGSAASRLCPEDVDSGYLAGARIFHTSGISQAISESSRAAVDAAIDRARAGGTLVSYDVNVRPRLWPTLTAREAAESVIPRADVVFVSAEDAGHLYGDEPLESVARRLVDAGPRLVVVKMGERGCTVVSRESAAVSVPAWKVDVLDATGAGDAFAAAFLVEWLRGADPARAAHFANAVGALTATGLGAVAPIPTRQRAEEFLAQGGESQGRGRVR